MNSRERVATAMNHKQPDKVPIDIGACNTTGISVSALYRLRDYYGLPRKDMPISEIMQMLGEVDDDIRRKLGGDVIGLNNPSNIVGVPLQGEMKLFHMPDGTPALVNKLNVFDITEEGEIFLYPQGNRNAKPSCRMPSGGYFFDIVDRAPEFDEDNLTPEEDFKDHFSLYSDEDARYLEEEATKLYTETEYSVMGVFGLGGLGDSAAYPGPAELNPKGIRSFADWNMAYYLYPDYCHTVFEMHTQNCLDNLEIYKQAVGDKIQSIVISGTDFGSQNAPLISVDTFREFYKPYFKRMNDWVHENTQWKTFYHSCGAVAEFLDDFIDMGVDLLNPVQLSAAGMDMHMLKEKYGDKIVFWGGGIDTQDMLPNGSPEQIKEQVKERLNVMARNGGFVFNTVHNIVGNVKPGNIAAAFEAAQEYQY